MDNVALDLILFVIGFFVLIRGASILIHGAVAIANIFKVSTWFIGVVIVSIGTSIPELSINLASAFSGSNVGIAAILGSNIFNIFFVLGALALMSPVVMHKQWVFRDLPTYIAVAVVAGLIILFPVLGDPNLSGISFEESIVLLAILSVWFLNMFRRWHGEEEKLDFEVVTVFTAFIMVIGGIVGVFFGGNWVVDGATTIAQIIGVSPTVIGFSVVALGTSLPEFVVSLAALKKGTIGIAVGNIVGSSMFNLLGVLGATAAFSPIVLSSSVTVDVLFMVFAGIAWFIAMMLGDKYTISRKEGLVFILLYFVFVVQLFVV